MIVRLVPIEKTYILSCFDGTFDPFKCNLYHPFKFQVRKQTF